MDVDFRESQTVFEKDGTILQILNPWLSVDY
jgi:hypothetical protein